MTFIDNTVKQICVEQWDANADGKFTYNEAAAVTDLGTAFQGKIIKSFAELYYFTGLTAVADDAFSNCKYLTAIRLPKKLKEVGARSFKGCVLLKQIDLPTGVKAIGEEAFSGCKTLEGVELPTELSVIERETFYGCTAFTSINLPVCVEKLGDKCFGGCTKLVEFTVNTYHPENILMGTSVFATINLSNATLNVLQGTKAYFLADDQWKAFGNIFEMRERSGGNFTTMEAGKTYYIYNVGTGRYLTKGEAWGTQAIVGTEPMRFKVNHSNNMPEGVYYLSTTDLGKTTYVFRTSNDGNVGKGVQAAYVDLKSLTSEAYWKVQEVSDKVYTFQIPSGGTNYAEGKFWGVQTDHQSSAASPTYGAYSDVLYADHKQNCHWQFVLYDESEEEKYQQGMSLLNLISMAESRNIDASEEQAVYDNLESTLEQIVAAQNSLRKKLKLIIFADPVVREACLSLFDSDRNNEISYTEAAEATDLEGLSFLNNTSLVNFDELQYFTNTSTLYANTFNGCVNLESVVLPPSIERIYYYAFRNCSKLTKITLPEYVSLIGINCFQGCTSLKEVTIENPDPSTITLQTGVFAGLTLANCTLYVPAGSKARYEAAATWKDFGKIVEMRMRTQPALSTIEQDVPGYIYHVGTRKMISLGEAYGTQSVVSRKGRLYQLKRNSNMAEGVYYLYDDASGKVVFRTSTDDKVGDGVKTCFGDGTLSNKAYWKLTFTDEKTFTLQVPETDATYVAGEYLGIDESHKSDVASPTCGLYWDLSGVSAKTTWSFISKEAAEKAKEVDAIVEKLAYMLGLAIEKGIPCDEEMAVYNDLNSTNEQMLNAIASLREKMHIINFADDKVRTICLENWDADKDGELTFEEAAAVTDIGELFRKASITEFEELKYFTSLTGIPESAFRDNDKLCAIVLPPSVTTIGLYALSSCSNLKYVAILNESVVIPKVVNGITAAVTLFVKSAVLEAYQASSDWTSSTAKIVEYTGVPVVTVEGSREYGKAITSTGYKVLVTGAPVNGTPTYSCEVAADLTTPVGDYPIAVEPGTITTSGLICRQGVFSIKQTKARITPVNCTREFGQPNPEFDFKCSGLKNSETISVLLKAPVITCEATIDSPVGTYDIVASGAEAQNYYFEYKTGKLTVTAATGIDAVKSSVMENQSVYDLQGRRIDGHSKKGIYVIRSAQGTKKVVRK
jgi:hypothetical protein